MVSLPKGRAPALAYLPTADFNLRHGGTQHRFSPGDAVAATVAAVASEGTAGRTLLHVPLTPATLKLAARPANAKAGGGKALKIPPPAAGAVVACTVESLHPLWAEVVLETGCRGRLHITEAEPPAPAPTAGAAGKKKKAAPAAAAAAAAAGPAASPLAGLAPGTKLSAVVLGKVQTPEGRRHGQVELSTRAAALAAAAAGEDGTAKPPPKALTWSGIKPGQQLSG